MAFAGALIGAGGSILSGLMGKGSASKAAKQQAAATQAALQQQQRQFDITRSDNMPFLTAGQGALGQTQGLLGLQGGDVQSQLIEQLRASPAFTSQYGVGQDTILQNAAATGGLRGGNTQNSLAQFGSGLLNQVIQQQLGNLGGLVNIGAGTAGQLGAIGQNNANSQSNLITQGGQNQAAYTLAGGNMAGRTINDLAGQLQSYGQQNWRW